MVSIEHFSGFLKIWRDGVLIVDYHGQLGTETGGQYLKLGVYEGYPEGVTSPIAVEYSNIVLSYNNASFPTPSTYGGSGQTTVDTTAPTVASLVASGNGITAGTGNLSTGSVVTLTLNLSEAVTVAGGTPKLTLNNGGTATYTGGSGSKALTFSYTVGAGQDTADLAVTAISMGAATVKDGAGNIANLVGAAINPAGTLKIDTDVHLTHVGNKYVLANSSGIGPTISNGGVAITDRQLGAWTILAAMRDGSGGYQLALKATGEDRYKVWSTDSKGNVISTGIGGVVSGSSSALQGMELSFNQDLNGDGEIGPVSATPTTRVEAFGSTALDIVGHS